MDVALRLFGTGLSLTGTLFQLGVIAATIPHFPACLCLIREPPMVTSIRIWKPSIDNPRPSGGAEPAELKCPGPSGSGDGYGVAAAPLPPGYDPFSHGDRALYACVLVTGHGKVLDVRLLRGTGEAALDRDLTAIIGHAWRFSVDGDAKAPSWQRIRLNSGL